MKLHDFTRRYRASGRTTRMLEEAARLVSKGKAVYIIAKHDKHLQRIVDDRHPGGGIKCEPIVPAGFDWVEKRVRGSHPNCVWLFDHFFIEQDPVFCAMFETLMQFTTKEKSDHGQNVVGGDAMVSEKSFRNRAFDW